MKKSLPAVLLALGVAALSAQSVPGPVAGPGPVPAPAADQIPDQNFTLRLLGDISPNMPIDVTLTATTAYHNPPRDYASNEISAQVGEMVPAVGNFPSVHVAIMFTRGPLKDTYSISYTITVGFVTQTPRLGFADKTFRGQVLLKPGQTVKVLDNPGQASLQCTLTPAAD